MLKDFMRAFFLLTFICSTAFFATIAQAQFRLSNEEDIAIALFKTGGQEPNYETLVRGLEDFARTPLARQPEFFAKHTARLRNAYQNYNPETGLLTIRTKAQIELHHEWLDKETERHSMSVFFGKDDALFFPYKLGDYNIAVVPTKMDARFTRDIAPSQYSLIKTSFGETNQGNAIIYIQLKPEKAYLDEPIKMGGLDQWALVADVVNLTMTDNHDNQMWNYSASWYVSPQTKELNDLYDEQAEQKKREMERENPLKPVQ
jgi:hypothetical protein